MNESLAIAEFPKPPAVPATVPPDGHKVGMITFFASETAFFSTLIVTYLIFLGHNKVGPTPAEVFSMPLAIMNTICLLSSSVTIHLADRMLRTNNRAGFLLLWLLTIVLGIAFLVGTGLEWYDLIVTHHLTIGRNMFGTTYYTLVGFHAAHVTVGVLLLLLIFTLVGRGAIRGPHQIGIELVSWYWHFVDGVWIVVFTVVYLVEQVGRSSMSEEREIGSQEKVEMPAATAWPIVFGLGIVLMGAGAATSYGFTVVGVFVFIIGLGGWISQLLPGRGHVHESIGTPVAAAPGVPGTVEPMVPGAPSYRFNLPIHVRPISSGAWGGLVGALLMPIPAMAYGLIDHGSIWFPINLLAGMVVPGLTDASLEHLREFHFAAVVLAIFIHLAFSVTFGLMYGVILPMLPDIKGGPILFGGVLMPLLWSGVCYGLMGVVNPLLGKYVNWYWFLLSQFVYGLAMSYVVSRFEKVAVAQPPR